MIKQKETCLEKNGKQIVKLRSSSIKFKNYFKQIAAPFKICTDFESFLKGVRGSDRNKSTLYTQNITNEFLAVLLIKLFALMINLVHKLFFTKEKMQSLNLLKQFLKNIIIANKLTKNHLNKNLVLSSEDEQRFQSSNKC